MLPIYWLLNMSFKTTTEIINVYSLWPKDFTLINYKTIFTDSTWYMGYVNSITYTVFNTIISVSAALPAAYLVTPLDVIKTRIQTPGMAQNYKGMFDLVKTMYRNEGLRVFFKGGDMRVLKSCPQFGITLFFYELLK